MPASRVVTVLTFNIHHAEGTDGRLDLDRVAKVMRSSGADVIGLQEVDRHYSERSNWADEARGLARRMHMHVVFAANIDNPPPAEGRPRIQYGTAILSRFPILSWSNTYLFRSPDQEQRGLLQATLDVNGVRVQAFNTHLAASSAVDRAVQAQQIEDIIGRTTDPTFLTGDMNATADAPEIKTLASFLTDSWTVAGVGPGNTIESGDPTKRIDYVFTNDYARPMVDRVVQTDPTASDHLPVAATMLLNGTVAP
ncbi:MAG TPA: endonuclease/exonuclease/phosphatase family protein [Mycobacteriales bacterium]|nr:endonuclease/exonuclease/phosphatase family protein [Mycobacteriales bacterium]